MSDVSDLTHFSDLSNLGNLSDLINLSNLTDLTIYILAYKPILKLKKFIELRCQFIRA